MNFKKIIEFCHIPHTCLYSMYSCLDVCRIDRHSRHHQQPSWKHNLCRSMRSQPHYHGGHHHNKPEKQYDCNDM